MLTHIAHAHKVQSAVVSAVSPRPQYGLMQGGLCASHINAVMLNMCDI